MRAIDDLIDDHKAKFITLKDHEKQYFISNVDNWLKTIKDVDQTQSFQNELMDTIERFRIPKWPLEAFAKSMIYDIYHDGFPTMQSFLEYAEGASVAPASIFVHLCGISHVNGHYDNPAFDIREASVPCAIFSYLVHIIRDFQKDQLNNLNYFANNLLSKFGLSTTDLRTIAEGGSITPSFRQLMNEYYTLAGEYRDKTREMITKIRPHLETRYQLSLDIIFNLYLMVYNRINIETGTFTTEELNATAQEIRKKVFEVILEFGS